MVKQKIIIVNSKKYEAIEKISLFLHILAFIVSFLTLISIIKTNDNKKFLNWDKILELITMIFVFLIIFIHLFQPVLKRKIVKKYLINFWGEKEMITYLSHPEKIDYHREGEMGRVIKQIDEKFQYLTKTYYKRTKLKTSLIIERTKKISGGEGKTFAPFTIIPSYIIVDLEEGKIEMTNKVTYIDGKKYNSPRHFYFDFKNETVYWSGQFPEVPYYGKWEWETKENGK